MCVNSLSHKYTFKMKFFTGIYGSNKERLTHHGEPLHSKGLLLMEKVRLNTFFTIIFIFIYLLDMFIF